MELAEEFQNWLDESKNLGLLQFTRAYFPNRPWLPLTECLELHAFSDASERGFGAVIYLRAKIESEYHVSFVTARSRVAPLKKVSLPRLELLGALMCARLVVYVKDALKLNNAKIFCYTDNETCLAWINNDPLRFKTFVANRTSEIQSLVPPKYWQHVSGVLNPADIASRGLMASELAISEMWLKGPEFLRLHDKSTTDQSFQLANVQLLETKSVICLSPCVLPTLFNFKRFSTLNKVITYVAYVLRFKNNCRLRIKDERIIGALSHEERNSAKILVWRSAQEDRYGLEVSRLANGKSIPKESSLSKLNPFLCSQGLLRKNSRLINADLDYDRKYPVIIPSGHIAVLLIKFIHIFLNHQGVDSIITALQNRI